MTESRKAVSSWVAPHLEETASIIPDKDGGNLNYKDNLSMVKNQPDLPSDNSTASHRKRSSRMFEIAFSLLTNSSGPLTKTIRPDDKGGIIKKPAANLVKGKAETISMPFEEFGHYLRTLNLNQALVHGISEHDGVVNIVTAAEYSGQPGTVTRTKDFLQYPYGPGVGMFDHDPKPGQPQLSPDEFLQILYGIYPDFRKTPTWTTPSTSACIFDLNGQQLTGEGAGFHMYFPFDPASKLPEFAQWLFKKFWLEGYGSIFVTKAGSLLERTLFDAAVFSPERIDFVAGANCIECEQRLSEPVYREALEVATI